MFKRNRQISKTPDKLQLSPASYHVQQKCAYHPKQNITNFCKCQDCLLPVCPICIQLHTDEHKAQKTNPKFEEINKVLADIKGAYEQLDSLVESIRKFLTDIQKQKKHNEAEIRQKMVENRQSLIRQFQKSLIDMQNKIINQIVKVGQQYVAVLSETDDELSRIKRGISKSRENLENEDILKHIIIYFGKRGDQKYKKQLERLSQKAGTLTKTTMAVTVKQDEISKIKQTINNYIKFQIIRSESQSNSIVKET